MNPNLRLFIESGLAVLVLGTCATVIRVSLRLYSVLKDFPPHRHVGEEIVYAKDFEPAQNQPLHVMVRK